MPSVVVFHREFDSLEHFQEENNGSTSLSELGNLGNPIRTSTYFYLDDDDEYGEEGPDADLPSEEFPHCANIKVTLYSGEEKWFKLYEDVDDQFEDNVAKFLTDNGVSETLAKIVAYSCYCSEEYPGDTFQQAFETIADREEREWDVFCDEEINTDDEDIDYTTMVLFSESTELLTGDSVPTPIEFKNSDGDTLLFTPEEDLTGDDLWRQENVLQYGSMRK